MSSKFLSSDGSDLSSLSNGLFALNVASATMQNLTPNLPLRATGTKAVISGLIQLADCNFVPIINPLTVNLSLGGNSITNINSISGVVNTCTADNIVSNAGTGVSGHVVTFSSDKVVQDGGTLLSALATNAGVASTYLPLAGGTMTGAINMNNSALTSVSAILPINTNVNIGNTISQALGSTGSIVIGDLTTALGSNSVCIGLQNIARTQSVAIGKETAAGASSVVIGYRSSSGINTDSVILGHDNTSAGTSADILGVNRTNNTAHSLLLGDGAYVNIRANATCDLGVVGTPFQSLYLSGSVSGPINTRTTDNIVSNAGTGALGSVVTFSSDKVVQDGGVLLSALATNAGVASTYLAKSGGTMTGGINMGNFNLSSINQLSGPVNTRLADNVVSNSGTGVSGRVVTFSSDKVVQDGGVLLSALATNAGVASTYLALAGGTMTGDINMASHQLNNLAKISGDNVSNNNTLWGTGGTLTGITADNIRNVAIGYNHSSTGFSIVSLGQSTAQTVGAGNCVLIGSVLNVAGGLSLAIGNSDTVTGTNSCAVGNSNTINGTSSFIFGNNANNSLSNSMIFGDSNIVNMRPNGNGTCDLGTLATPFRNLLLTVGVDSVGAALTVGSTNATSLTLGKAGITTLANGIFASSVSYASWYSTTTYSPSFNAGLNKMTPPTASTAGTLVDFTQANGVLTYTGARTRTFHVDYNITFTAGTMGSNMTFFNSINGSPVIGNQTQIKEQIYIQNSGVQMTVKFSDNISLSTGNTVQLASACALTSTAVGYNFISCGIFALVN